MDHHGQHNCEGVLQKSKQFFLTRKNRNRYQVFLQLQDMAAAVNSSHLWWQAPKVCYLIEWATREYTVHEDDTRHTMHIHIKMHNAQQGCLVTHER